MLAFAARKQTKAEITMGTQTTTFLPLHAFHLMPAEGEGEEEEEEEKSRGGFGC